MDKLKIEAYSSFDHMILSIENTLQTIHNKSKSQNTSKIFLVVVTSSKVNTHDL